MSRFFATGSDSETESSDEEVPVQAYSKATNFVSKHKFDFKALYNLFFFFFCIAI